MYKFLNRAWRIVNDLAGNAGEETLFQPGSPDEKVASLAKVLNRERHRVSGKVADDFARNNFNTAISAIMELCNAASDYLHAASADARKSEAGSASFDVDIAETIVKLMAPIVPHWAEELWTTVLGHENSVHLSGWPEYDLEQAKDDEVELAVQICGKVKSKITVAAGASNEEIEAKAREAVARQLEGKNVVKVIVVPSRLVNIVAK